MHGQDAAAERRWFAHAMEQVLRRFQLGDHFNPDELNTALGEIHILLEQLISQTGKICGRSGRGLYHAMVQSERANLQR